MTKSERLEIRISAPLKEQATINASQQNQTVSAYITSLIEQDSNVATNIPDHHTLIFINALMNALNKYPELPETFKNDWRKIIDQYAHC